MDLVDGEFVLGFDFVVKLPTLEKLDADVDGVLALVDFEQPHEILVVEAPHEFDFVDERFFSFVFSIGRFLRKGFDRKLLAVFLPDGKVYACEVPLTDLLNRFEELVESLLVQSS